MAKFDFKKFVSFLAYVAVVMVAVLLLFTKLGVGGSLAGTMADLANYISMFVVAVASLAYARSKRNKAYLIVWVAAVVLLVVSFFL